MVSIHSRRIALERWPLFHACSFFQLEGGQSAGGGSVGGVDKRGKTDYSISDGAAVSPTLVNTKTTKQLVQHQEHTQSLRITQLHSQKQLIQNGTDTNQ